MEKVYNPKEVEEKWYSFWKKEAFFSADAQSKKEAFCIIIPPPNITGALHMGHALGDTLQDIIIRYKRMMGYEALWIPGIDHAGISTQTIVEKHLMQTRGKKRTDFSRKEFLDEIWKWKEEKGTQILKQLEKLGCSCDWSRLRFTLDEKSNLAVKTLFKKMFDDGLIYQGDYLVNWDPLTKTALADDEVEVEERDSFLWYFRYPLEEKGYIVIATTRPETMLGDTAVAVSPKDERFKTLINKKVILPLAGRSIPIIEDYMVDPSFGTGAVKITPAHDLNDYEVGLRHKLPIINILTEEGLINENGGAFKGLTILQAREAVVEGMKKLGLVEKIEPYKVNLGISYRSKAVIEPFLSKQWFLKMSAFKEELKKVVISNKVLIIPEQWRQNYLHWIENLKDWCISRQLWWGHQIPVWHNSKTGEKVCFIGEGSPFKGDENWKQDEDVLDTWFSSALWPLSTLGWPNDTKDLKKFYPTSLLITGHDIIFFWVARMIMMGEYALHKVPFHETFIHGLIYGKSYSRKNNGETVFYVSKEEKDKYDMGAPVPSDISSKWEKMSKSKGNVIDPLEIIDLYGTDATRLALTSTVTHASQIDLDRRRFDEFKNFTNKIWNAARFIFINLDTEPILSSKAINQGFNNNLFTLEDRWILSLLNRKIEETHKLLKEYAFDKFALSLYSFFWNDFCAYYLELSKPYFFNKTGTPEIRENKQKMVLFLLSSIIRLLHPVTPFITEEIFSLLKKRFPDLEIKGDAYTKELASALNSKACIVAPYPKAIGKIDEEAESEFAFVEKMVHAIRTIRAEMALAPTQETDLYVVGTKELKQEQAIKCLGKIGTIYFEDKEIKGSSAVVDNLKLLIPLPASLLEKEKGRILKEKEKLLKQYEQVKAQLENKEFLEKAPKEIISKMEQNLYQLEKKLKNL